MNRPFLLPLSRNWLSWAHANFSYLSNTEPTANRYVTEANTNANFPHHLQPPHRPALKKPVMFEALGQISSTTPHISPETFPVLSGLPFTEPNSHGSPSPRAAHCASDILLLLYSPSFQCPLHLCFLKALLNSFPPPLLRKMKPCHHKAHAYHACTPVPLTFTEGHGPKPTLLPTINPAVIPAGSHPGLYRQPRL